tara:strand:- start:6737 stop:6964 length:228 start_codon:yes stop_codon:yes gene_type:complete
MNGAEREELRALTRQLADFQVEVTRQIVPRTEIDAMEESLRNRIYAAENKAMRWAISLGVLNLGGWASLIWMMAQ